MAVAKIIWQLDCSIAAGPDTLHPCFLKSSGVALSWPLYILYVQSLEESAAQFVEDIHYSALV